jgi:peroxiredoxin
MKLLLSGEKAPDFALQTVDGEPHGLYEALQNNSVVLLIFLRHLG